MASEYVLRIPLDRHIINTARPFATVIEEIRECIGRSKEGEEHGPSASELGGRIVRYVNGSPAPPRLVGLGELDVDCALAGPSDDARVVRFLVDVPTARGKLVGFLPDAGANCPVTILIQEIVGVGTRLVYDSVGSAVSAYQDNDLQAAANQVDIEILSLLRRIADR